MKNFFFTIVVTTYNSEEYIESAFCSVINQTYKNYEVLIIDDGSTDNTEKIIHNIKKNFKCKFFFYKLEHFGGPAKSRNFGISKSLGDWVFFLDGDDTWYPNKLEIVNKTLNNVSENISVFYHDELLSKSNKKLLYKKVNNHNAYKDLFFNGNKISLSSSCIKKSFLIKKNIKFSDQKNLISVEDYDFWLNIAKHRGSFFHINKILGYYNFNQKSLSGNRILHFVNTLNVIGIHQHNFNNKFKLFLLKAKIIFSFIIIAIKEKNLKLLIFSIRKIKEII